MSDALRQRPVLLQDSTIPHGVSAQTVDTYAQVWDRYVAFARSRGFSSRIPGKHLPWDMELLWAFMQFRACTCKPATVISNISALAHFGWRAKFILPTSRTDGDPVGYREITAMKKQLKLDFRAAHGDLAAAFGPERCCPLGNAEVCLILTALRIFDRSSFRRLSRYSRHHVVASVMQHSHGMRFGHFIARMYTRAMFIWSQVNREFSLVTDWHRYSGRHRYVLRFRLQPELPARVYTLKRGNREVHISAAMIMQWHFADLKACGEHVVFCPRGPGIVPLRSERQRWLRLVLLAALPRDEVKARAQVEDVTPHSWRPGFAGDLLAAGMPIAGIQLLCRWLSERTAKMYAERPSLSSFRVHDDVVLLHEQAAGVYVPYR